MVKINEINKLVNGNRAYYIEIFSFSNPDSKVKFPAFLTDFTDSYVSDWKEESVYGKMDPIATFKSTKRSINISFDIPSDSIETARENLDQLDYLIRGLYPVYDNGVLGTATLASPPMFRVRFSNFIRNVAQMENGSSLKSGLLCYIKGFDFKPKVDSGFFTTQHTLYPKLVTANLVLQIIHEHALGKYVNEGKVEYRANFDGFPHKTGSARSREYRAKTGTTKGQTNNSSEEAERSASESECLGD